MCHQQASLALHPTFCGQNFLDTQVLPSYTQHYKKAVLINSIIQSMGFQVHEGQYSYGTSVDNMLEKKCFSMALAV